MNDYIKISNYYKEKIDIFRGLKIALISIIPKGVVMTELFKAKAEGYVSKPFSTEQSAIEWILS